MALSDFSTSNIAAFEHQYGFMVIENPTGNCQLFSVKYFNDALRMSDSDEMMKNIIRDFKALASKPQMLVDVDQSYEGRLDKLFRPEQFLVKSKYTNGTGSNMMICVINLAI